MLAIPLFCRSECFCLGFLLGCFLNFPMLAIFCLAISLIPSQIYTAKTDNPSQPLPILTALGSDNNIE